jgi:hypothetical protein
MITKLFTTLLVACASQYVTAQESRPLPQPDIALGMLTAIVYTAEAVRKECPAHVGDARVDAVLDPWFKRNEPFAERLFAYGRSAQWSPKGESDPNRWAQMQEQDRSRVRSWLIDQLNPLPSAGCADLLLLFKNGTNEIGNFPVHLKVLGIPATQ